MQIVRTIVWVVLLFALMAFSVFNWKPVEVQIWPNLVLETKLPALVIIAFLMGFVPMWLIHRAHRWRSHRRMTAMEQAAARMAGPAPTPSGATPDALAAAPAPAPVADAPAAAAITRDPLP